MKMRLSIIGGTLFLLTGAVNADIVLYDLDADGGMQGARVPRRPAPPARTAPAGPGLATGASIRF